MVDKFVARGLPWAIAGVFNMRAGPMNQWLDASEHSGKVALGLDTEFVFIKEAIVRWSREVEFFWRGQAARGCPFAW